MRDQQTIDWLRGLAAKGGKGVVNNIDARCLGRIADELERLYGSAQMPELLQMVRDAHARGFSEGSQELTRLGGAAQARQASPQEVQEACAQVADRAQARDAEDYTAALKDEALSHTGREAILERLDASRSRARDIGISIRALIPSTVSSTDREGGK